MVICCKARATSAGVGKYTGGMACVIEVAPYQSKASAANVAAPTASLKAADLPSPIGQTRQLLLCANAVSLGSRSTMRMYSVVIYAEVAGASAIEPELFMNSPIWVSHLSTSEVPLARSMIFKCPARSKVGRVSNSLRIDASEMVTP